MRVGSTCRGVCVKKVIVHMHAQNNEGVANPFSHISPNTQKGREMPTHPGAKSMSTAFFAMWLAAFCTEAGSCRFVQ